MQENKGSLSLLFRSQCTTAIAAAAIINPLTGTLQPQSNEQLCSNTETGTLAVDGWAVTFGTARRGLGGPRPVPDSLYQM